MAENIGLTLEKIEQLLKQIGRLVEQVGLTLKKIGRLLERIGRLVEQVGLTLKKIGWLLKWIDLTIERIGRLGRQIGRWRFAIRHARVSVCGLPARHAAGLPPLHPGHPLEALALCGSDTPHFSVWVACAARGGAVAPAPWASA